MILYQIMDIVIGFVGYIKDILLVIVFAPFKFVDLGTANHLQSFLGYADYFFPAGVLKPLLVALMYYYTIMLALWILKKVKEIPGVP